MSPEHAHNRARLAARIADTAVACGWDAADIAALDPGERNVLARHCGARSVPLSDDTWRLAIELLADKAARETAS